LRTTYTSVDVTDRWGCKRIGGKTGPVGSGLT
jgi:hypothetical protein